MTNKNKYKTLWQYGYHKLVLYITVHYINYMSLYTIDIETIS